MFTHIRTSKENRDIVAQLTRKLNLGTENFIARIALTYSLTQGKKLNLSDIKNSSGKQYTKNVLFGDYADYYIGMVALHYDVHTSDKDISKYIKMHIDDGLELLNQEIEANPNMDGFDFLINKVEDGLSAMLN